MSEKVLNKIYFYATTLLTYSVGGKMKEKIVLECKDKNYDFRFLGSINPRFIISLRFRHGGEKTTNLC